MKHSTAEHGGESATTRVRLEPSLPLTFGAPSVSNPPWPSEFEGVTDVVPPSPLLPMLPQPLLLPMPPSPPMPPLLENATTSVPSMPPLPLTLRLPSSGSSQQSPPPQPGGFPNRSKHHGRSTWATSFGRVFGYL